MFADPLTIYSSDLVDALHPTQAGVLCAFTRTGILGTSSTFRVPISQLPHDDPLVQQAIASDMTLRISHEETGKGAGKRVRSLIRFDLLPTDIAGKKQPVSAYMVLDRPTAHVTQETGLDVVAAEAAGLLWLRNFLTMERLSMFVDRTL